MLLKLINDIPVSNFACTFSLRRYIQARYPKLCALYASCVTTQRGGGGRHSSGGRPSAGLFWRQLTLEDQFCEDMRPDLIGNSEASASAESGCWQGLTLVHCSAQREHFLSHVVGYVAGFSDKNGSD
jgi:hypothetical protein